MTGTTMARRRLPATDRKANMRSRRALLLASASLAALLVAVPVHGTRAAETPFDGLSAMSDGELGEQRGGFSWGQITFNFGFAITTAVQNAMQAGQAFQVVTTFTMSQSGQFDNLQTAVTLSDDQTADTSGIAGTGNVTVTTVNPVDFNFGLDFSSNDDGGDGSWGNVVVHGPGSSGAAAVSAPQAPTPPTITPPTPPTVTPPTPPSFTTTADVTPPAPTIVTPPVTTQVTPPAPTIVTPPVTTQVTPPAPTIVTPPVTTQVTPVTPSAPEPVTTTTQTAAAAVAPPPIPVAVMTTPLSGGGQQVSVGDPLATQIIQSVSGAGITSVVTNRLSNRLVQENMSMDVVIGGAQVFSSQSVSVRNAVSIGRSIGLLGLRK